MHKFQNILVVHGAGSNDKQPLQQAVTLAQQNKAALTVAMIVKDPDASPKVIDDREKQLRAIASSVGDNHVEIHASVLVGIPFLQIIRQVLRNQHDLVVMGAEQERGLKSLFLGSTAFHLLRKCPCPVWITRSRASKAYTRILAAVDPNPDNPEAFGLNCKILDLATSFAIWNESELHIIHAWDVNSREQDTLSSGINEKMRHKLLDKAKDRYRERIDALLSQYDFGDLDYRVHLKRGVPEVVIPELVEKQQIDLVIMGTVCRTGIPGFFIGNTAEYVLHAIDCSVLAVKPEGFVTPVTLED
ncbi:MAG: universal stress protein [Alphaproteobacteria bacterium]